MWQAITEEDWGTARRLLAADPALLASPDGQFALGYVLAFGGEFDAAQEVYTAQRELHRGQALEHVALHQLGMVARMRGDAAQALALFEEEAELIRHLPDGEQPSKRAVNGYELGVNLRMLGRVAEARTALLAALGDAETVRDPMTLGCLHRAHGELASAEGGSPQEEYALAAHFFRLAGDERAAGEVEGRL